MNSQGTSEFKVTVARSLRRNKTPAERKLWRALRELNASGSVHFRQQAPIGRFIADFCEHTCKLIIEVDGGQHNESDGLSRDAERTAWLQSRGYLVIRFSNIEVFKKFDGVVIAIQIATGTLPADSSVIDASVPSPLAGEGQGGGDGPEVLPTLSNLPHQPPTPNPSPQGGGESQRCPEQPPTGNHQILPGTVFEPAEPTRSTGFAALAGENSVRGDRATCSNSAEPSGVHTS